MNAGWWGLLILIFAVPGMAAGGALMYWGFHAIKVKDKVDGWFAVFVGWFVFWLSALYGAAFIIDNLTP